MKTTTTCILFFLSNILIAQSFLEFPYAELKGPVLEVEKKSYRDLELTSDGSYVLNKDAFTTILYKYENGLIQKQVVLENEYEEGNEIRFEYENGEISKISFYDKENDGNFKCRKWYKLEYYNGVLILENIFHNENEFIGSYRFKYDNTNPEQKLIDIAYSGANSTTVENNRIIGFDSQGNIDFHEEIIEDQITNRNKFKLFGNYSMVTSELKSEFKYGPKLYRVNRLIKKVRDKYGNIINDFQKTNSLDPAYYIFKEENQLSINKITYGAKNKTSNNKNNLALPRRKTLHLEPNEILPIAEIMPMLSECEELELSYDKTYKCYKTILNAYVNKHLIYPKVIENEKKEGKCTVEVTIDKYGEMKDIKVIEKIGKEYGKEALNVFNKMKNSGKKWKPGMLQGKPVSVNLWIPVQFTK